MVKSDLKKNKFGKSLDNSPKLISEKGTKINDFRFDILKAIAILLIMMEHTNLLGLPYELSFFCVPLIVFASGAVYQISSQINYRGYLDYLKHRFFRLLAPVWVGLDLIFLATILSYSLAQKAFPFTIQKIIGSYYFYAGIEQFWIIRVFVLVALVAPLLFHFKKQLGNKKFVVGLFLLYLAYEISYFMCGKINLGIFKVFVREYLFYLLPYAVMFGVGMLLLDLKRKQVIILGVVSFILWLILFLFYNNFVIIFDVANIIWPKDLKFPSLLYFNLYGLFSMFFIYALVFKRKIMQDNLFDKSIKFLSKYTLSLFIWHRLFIYQFRVWLVPFFPKYDFWPFFLIVFIASVIAVLIQNIVLDYLFKLKKAYFKKKIN